MARPQDKETGEDRLRTLLFVDVLGFGAITEECGHRVRHSESERYVITETTEMQGRINRFNNVLDKFAFDECMNGHVQAMLFSDCAFVVFETSLEAALSAAALMRNFIKRGVPVRMGLGRGTFYDLEYSTKTNGAVLVSKSRFMGTAVVRAHAAEECEGKGMRIFLGASVEPDLPAINSRLKTLPLPEPLSGVKGELGYLHEPGPLFKHDQIEAGDRELFENVLALRNPDWPPHIQKHYSDTLAAMNRMREAYHREHLDVSNIPYRGTDTLWL